MRILEETGKKRFNRLLMIRKKVVFKGAIYHITQRAPGKETLFLEESDYLAFLDILRITLGKFDLELFCFALLPNHLHLLLRIKEENLSKAVKNLFEKYANYYNKKYERKGHVFSGRYRASLCNHETYLLATSLYIHLNPYKAGLCENFDEHRWSSIRFYIGSTYGKTFVNFRELLLLIDSEIKKAREEYHKMLEQSAVLKGGALLDEKLGAKFVREVNKIVNKVLGKETNLEKLIDRFKSQKRVVRPEDKKARKYLIEQLLSNGYSVKEISKMLSINTITAYRILK